MAAGYTNPEELLHRLKSGNHRFATGDLRDYLLHLGKGVTVERRQELTGSQHPFVSVLSCSDSRAAPELVFGQGLGEIFVVRTAGAIADSTAIGSLEYGVVHLGTTLLLIMGHAKCGAVTAAVEFVKKNRKGGHHGGGGDQSPHIAHIISTLKGPVEGLYDQYGDDPNLVDLSVRANVLHIKKNLLHQSEVLRKYQDEGKLTVVCGFYSLDSGYVEIIPS